MIRKKTYFNLITVLALGWALEGCATSYNIIINAYLDKTDKNAGVPMGAPLAVLTNPSVPNALFDNEIKSKIECLLVFRGYRLAPKNQAEYWIRYSYTIAGSTQTVEEPRLISRPGVVRRVYVSGSNKVYTIVRPEHDYVTYVPRIHVVYVSKLFVQAIDRHRLTDTGEQKVVWVGDTISQNSSSDLREFIDYLLVGTFRFFNQDTVKNQVAILTPNDKEISQLRSLSPNPSSSSENKK